jgi:hypothetical protein
MTCSAAHADIAAFRRLIDHAGRAEWSARIASIRSTCTPSHAGRALAHLHTLELALDRLMRDPARHSAPAGATLIELAGALGLLHDTLSEAGRSRLLTAFRDALTGANTLVPLLHLIRSARLHQRRGFTVRFTGLEDGTAFDLLIERHGTVAEVICATVSAEDGRDVHRFAWSHLVDRIDPTLQAWLSTHPGRYLLKMTLPHGLKAAATGSAALADLHARITNMLSEQRRGSHDEAAVLRLEPLLLAGAQANENGLMRNLRAEFGPEAHLAVTAAGAGMFVMAARAAREDEVAVAVQRRMAEIAPTRFSFTRPGILAMFIEDTDRLEWRRLRDQLLLEGAARHFLTTAEAKCVAAVTCTSRLELLGGTPPDAASDGELRYRNPSHPQSALPALAPSVLSAH